MKKSEESGSRRYTSSQETSSFQIVATWLGLCLDCQNDKRDKTKVQRDKKKLSDRNKRVSVSLLGDFNNTKKKSRGKYEC